MAQGGGQGSPTFVVAGGRLRIEVCTDDVVRVAFAPDEAFFARPSLMAAPKRCTTPAWKLTKTDEVATIATARLRVKVDLTTGAVSFADAGGRPILAERAGGRSMIPATVAGERTHHVRQQWEPHDGERLYGLGQHQQGLLDIKGTDLELRQYNGEIFIPLLVSNRGYGILWDNTSLTRFGRTEPPAWEEIPGLATGAADWTKAIAGATAPPTGRCSSSTAFATACCRTSTRWPPGSRSRVTRSCVRSRWIFRSARSRRPSTTSSCSGPPCWSAR
jgi:alpha-D-xyloside xylohydrolase